MCKKQRKFSLVPGALVWCTNTIFCNWEELLVLRNLEMYIAAIIIEHIIKTVSTRFQMSDSLLGQQDQGHQIHHEDPRRE